MKVFHGMPWWEVSVMATGLVVALATGWRLFLAYEQRPPRVVVECPPPNCICPDPEQRP